MECLQQEMGKRCLGNDNVEMIMPGVRPLHNPVSLGSVKFLTHLRPCSLNRESQALRPQTVHNSSTDVGHSRQPNGHRKKPTMNVRKSCAKVSLRDGT